MQIVLFVWSDFLLFTFMHLIYAIIQKDLNEVEDYLFEQKITLYNFLFARNVLDSIWFYLYLTFFICLFLDGLHEAVSHSCAIFFF